MIEPICRRPGCPAPRRQRLAKPLGLALAALLLAGPVGARPPAERKAPVAAPEIAEKQADLGELRGRIDSLRKELSVSEDSKADAASRLREAERRIGLLQRELDELAEQRARLQERLRSLEQQAQELGGVLAQQQGRLEGLLYRQYLRGTPDSLQLLLNGDDPNQMARDLHYFSAIAQSRAELMGDIRANLARKKALAGDAKDRAAELAAVEAEQQKRRGELEKQRLERQALYAQLADKVRSQRKEIGNLQQDEKRLSQLIDKLSKVLAAQAEKARLAEIAARKARQAAAEKESRRAAAAERDSERGREAARPRPAPEPEAVPAPTVGDGSFARAPGNLRLPVRGPLLGRFGAPRDGGGTWRGVFIKAASGSDVKALAGGRVVFAEWMRGFGNLLIIDHGNAYLSIYGNNESLLKQVGQNVRSGDTVATVGNSGGNPESGLYFELRHQGQPIDPLKWASVK